MEVCELKTYEDGQLLTDLLFSSVSRAVRLCNRALKEYGAHISYNEVKHDLHMHEVSEQFVKTGVGAYSYVFRKRIVA